LKRHLKNINVVLTEVDYKKITVIGFWRMGADVYEIAYLVELPIEVVEKWISDYKKRKNIKQ
jgi:hypothetical protein